MAVTRTPLAACVTALTATALLAGCSAPATVPTPVPTDIPVVEQTAELPDTTDAPPRATTEDRAPTVNETLDYLTFVLGDLETMWTRIFVDSGLAEPVTEYVIVLEGETHTSTCTWPNGEAIVMDWQYDNAIFCPLDGPPQGVTNSGAIILPLGTMQRIFDGDAFGISTGVAGDFGAAMVVAHEYGHAVVDELAIQYQTPYPGVPGRELIADCFAGVWAASAFTEGYLDDGDIDEGLAVLAVIGDAPGQVDHGTARQRKAAFLLGYQGDDAAQGGDPNTCMVEYWR